MSAPDPTAYTRAVANAADALQTMAAALIGFRKTLTDGGFAGEVADQAPVIAFAKMMGVPVPEVGGSTSAARAEPPRGMRISMRFE